MMPAEKVTWALRFAGMNLERMEKDGHRLIADDIREVLKDVPLQWSDEHFTHERVGAIQREIRELLRAVGFAAFTSTYTLPDHAPLPWIGTKKEALRRSTEKRQPSPAKMTMIFARPFLSIQGLVLVTHPGGGALYLQGDMGETLLFALANAVVAIGPHQVTMCPACQYPFVPQHGHQKFCSTVCKNRSALANFRQRQRAAKAARPKGKKRAG